MLILSVVLAAAVSGPADIPKTQPTHPSAIPSPRRVIALPKETFPLEACKDKCLFVERLARHDPFVRHWRAGGLSAFATRNIKALERRFVREFGPEMTNRIFEEDLRVVLYGVRRPRVSRKAVEELKAKMLSDLSVARGVAFYREHRDDFDRAAKEYGIDAFHLVAVVRIETDFGDYLFDPNNPQNHVFNLFFTRAVRLGSRRAERTLIAFVRYCIANGFDPLDERFRGSWAGAFGYTQIMPFNLATYGTDGNEDGVVDLYDVRDAVFTAAKFLRDHGYRRMSASSHYRAIARFYGSKGFYPTTTLAYAPLVRKHLGKPRASV